VAHYRGVHPSRQTGSRGVGEWCNLQVYERVRWRIPTECKQCMPSAAVPHGGPSLLPTFTQLTSAEWHPIPRA